MAAPVAKNSRPPLFISVEDDQPAEQITVTPLLDKRAMAERLYEQYIHASDKNLTLIATNILRRIRTLDPSFLSTKNPQ
jgi:hypothetical protein